MLAGIRSRLLGRRGGEGNDEKLAGRTFSFDAIARTSDPVFHLAITAIVKNVAPYLREWIEFHRLVGVEHFFMYNNESTDGTADILEAYRKAGLVTAFAWPSMTGWNGQYAAYAHSTKTQRTNCRWMMFIDIDEFVFPSEGTDLRLALAAYADRSIVKLPWRCFGHDGHKTRPPTGLVIENYTARFYNNPAAGPGILKRLTKRKSIVDPCRVVSIHPHEPEMDDDRSVVDGTTMLLNHYILRSEQEFSEKLSMGYGYRASETRKTRADKLLELRDALEASTVKDTLITRFVPALKDALASEGS
jgi:hypothetical protein